MNKSKCTIKFVKMRKKGDFENLKIQNFDFSTQSPISAVFPIVWLSGDQKTALTGESLYMQ